MTFLIFLVVAALIAYRAIPKDTTAQLPRLVLTYVAIVRDFGRAETAPFHAALATRGRWLVATSALAVLSVVSYKFAPFDMMASVGPRTTNGEWWRLVTAMFAHGGLLLLVVDVAALVQLGSVLERLVGRFAFVTTFVASGLLAGLTTLSTHPLQPYSSASGGLAGLYALLLVSFVAGRLHRSDVTIPIAEIKRAAPIAAAFVVVNLIDHSWNLTADFVGFVVGIGVAAFVGYDVSEGWPSTRHVAMALGGAFIVTVASAIPLRGILDVKPELQKVVALEHRTTQMYDSGAARMRAGAITADGLASLIKTSILPALQAEDDRLAALKHVPSENAASIADARRYVHLRIDSWTLRIQSLREPSGPPDPVRVADGESPAAFRARAQARHRAVGIARGRAEAAEREALDAFARIGPAS